MSWVGCETMSGGRVQAQPRATVAIHDSQSDVELATAAGGQHVMKYLAV
jgi:hypothetical protein